MIKIFDYGCCIEVIGDSFFVGMYIIYEGFISWVYGFGVGLGNIEYFVIGYLGICVVD